MKKLVLISLVLILCVSCKKMKESPEGPVDIRIRNLSDQTFNDLIVKVNTSEDGYNFGTLPAHDTTEYHRFGKAYPKADIQTTINGQSFKTDLVDYTYLVVLGQGKFTYEVWMSNPGEKKITIFQVIPDAPLGDK